jgi:predicted DNA-binding transcriptional regulator AlpA
MAHPEITGRKISGRKLIGGYQALQKRGIRFSRVHVRRLEKAGRFPMHVKPGGEDSNFIDWFEHEIDEYLESLRAARDAKMANLGGANRR